MTKVTGYLNQLSDAPSDSIITAESAIAPVFSGQKLQVPGKVSTKGRMVPVADGYWELDLSFGSYFLSVAGQRLLTITVGAEHAGLTVSFDQLVVSAVPTPQAPVGGAQPTASASVLGLVRTDESVATPVVVTGIFWKADYAAVRALANAANNKTVFVTSRGEAFDWAGASLAVDDSATVLKPTATSALNPGRWLKRGDIATMARTNGFSIAGAVYDADGLITSANVTWADGSAGVYTTTLKNTTFNTVDAWTITHTRSGLTATQAALTRDADGYITDTPAITLA